MKGVVIDFSIQTNNGLISGDDGNRYHFIGAEWRESIAPVRGMRVDFDTDGNNIALAIYQEIITKPPKVERPAFRQSAQKPMPKPAPKPKPKPKAVTEYEYIDESDYKPMDWFKKVVFENYANFEGRARRAEYWWFTLLNFGFVLITIFLDAIIMAMDAPFIVFMPVYLLATALPHLAVCVRRLHDINHSGWFLLASAIPFVNIIASVMLVIWFATEGDDDENDYGYPTK